MSDQAFSEEATSKTVQAMDTTIHYHEVGSGDPLLLLHSYGPGTTAWITWHRVLPMLAERFRCIAMDLPNFTKTGPVYYQDEPTHNVQARTAVALLDALGIEKAHIVGNSQGGQSSMVLAYNYPERVEKLIWGDGHIGSGGGYPNEYLISNRNEEGVRASYRARANPTLENFRDYLDLHIVDKSLITDELCRYLLEAHTARPDLLDGREKSKSVPRDHSAGMRTITAPTLMIWGRNDRTCTFEIGINALNLIPNSRLVLLRDTGHWPPFERPQEYAAHVLNFLEADWA